MFFSWYPYGALVLEVQWNSSEGLVEAQWEAQ